MEAIGITSIRRLPGGRVQFIADRFANPDKDVMQANSFRAFQRYLKKPETPLTRSSLAQWGNEHSMEKVSTIHRESQPLHHDTMGENLRKYLESSLKEIWTSMRGVLF